MRRQLVAIVAVLLVAPAAAATPPHLTPSVVRTVERLKASHGTPLYYLGLGYRGMTLVRAETVGPPTDFDYADCTADELSVSALACRHVLYLEEWPPTPGEISTQGRCTFATTVRGVTAALFPVNPTTLRVFTRATTIEITGSTRASELAAVRAFRALNVALAPGAPFPARDVNRLLGRCRTPRAQPPPTARQAYARRMQRAFTIESASPLDLSTVSARVADPRAVVREFLGNTRTFPLLLRTEAQRLSAIRPPRRRRPSRATDPGATRVRLRRRRRAAARSRRGVARHAALGRDVQAAGSTLPPRLGRHRRDG